MRTTTGLALLLLLTVTACARPDGSGGTAGDGADAGGAPGVADPDTGGTDADPQVDVDAGPGGTPEGLVAADYTGRFRVDATVLESPEHGPQLCWAVLDSYPPQCGGPDVLGWDWTAVQAESANGTTWGSYFLEGTWDGTAFTVLGLAADGPDVGTREEMDFSAPCPEPAGGWAPVDPDRATQDTLSAALGRAAGETGYAGAWVDQRGGTDNDPRRLVLVVRTAGDPAAMQTALREVWGGALCVTGARFTQAELMAAQRALDGDPGVVGSSPNDVTNRLEVTVWVATVERQAELDATYGPGLVVQTGILTPID